MKNIVILFLMVSTGVVMGGCKKKAPESGSEPPVKEAAKPIEKGSQLAPISLVLPKPMFQGTPENLSGVENLEKPLGKPRPAFLAPEGTQNLALNKSLTSSEMDPITGALEMIVDGDKDATEGSVVELGPFKQWVQIDLGQVSPIDEIRLIPGQPVDWPALQGFGFPNRFKLELSLEPVFRDVQLAADHTTEDYPNPGDNAVVVPTHGQEARYVRVTATRLFAKNTPGTRNACVLALADRLRFSAARRAD